MTGDHVKVDLAGLRRELETMTADLELICNAFMEGQPPGSCYTPAQIAEWVRKRRAEEIRQAERRARAALTK